MLCLVCAEGYHHVYLVGGHKITQLGGWIRWKIWQWIFRSGEVVVISNQVRLFEDDRSIGQTEISVCWPRWRIFTLVPFGYPFHVCFIIVSEIMKARKLTISTCCMTSVLVWDTIARLLMMMMIMVMMINYQNVMKNILWLCLNLKKMKLSRQYGKIYVFAIDI